MAHGTPGRKYFGRPPISTGTTFLFDELVSRHPQIKGRTNKDAGLMMHAATGKEPHYFHRAVPTDFGDYVDGFALSGYV